MQMLIGHGQVPTIMPEASFMLAFPKLPRIKKQGNLFEEFSQNSVKTVLCGVVGNERTSRGFGIPPNKQNLSDKP